MNRHVAIILFLALAAVVVLSGCNRPQSQGPIPAPQAAGTTGPTAEPLSQVTPQAPAPSGATAAPQGPAAGGAAPTAAPTQAPGQEAQPTPAAQPTPQPTAQPQAAAASGGPTQYTVKPGEWLFSIAHQYNVSPFTLAQVNGIGWPYRIYPGQVLTIPGSQPPSPPPAPGTCSSPYTVQPRDTVYSIARKCGKTPSAILSANNLANPNFLLVGQTLQIP